MSPLLRDSPRPGECRSSGQQVATQWAVWRWWPRSDVTLPIVSTSTHIPALDIPALYTPITVLWCSTHPDQTAGDRKYLDISFHYMWQYLILQRWQWPLQGVQRACSSTAAAHHYNNFGQNKWPRFVFLVNILSRCSHALYLLLYYHCIFIPLPPPPFWHKIIFTSINQWR